MNFARILAATTAISILLGALLGVASAQVPGSVTPGGARPPEEERLTTPVAEPPALLIPPVSAGRPVEEDEGPKIRVSEINLDVEPVLAEAAGAGVVAGARDLVRQKLAAQPAQDFTIRQLELVAESVTAYFRDRGYALAYAYLPAQDVPGGKVTVGVLAGRLGQVKVEGNDSYSAERLAAPFAKLQGQPVEVSSLESRVLALRDYPGLSPAAVLSPGTEVGTSDLTLRVSERRLEAYLTGDNYGSYSSGQYRATAGVAFNNPAGLGDRLELAVIQAFDPAENTYGSARYEIPASGPDARFYANYSLSAYDVGNESDVFGSSTDISLDGESRIASFGLVATPYRQLTSKVELDFSVNLKHAEFQDPGEEGGPSTLRQDDLAVFSFELRSEGADDWLGRLGLTQIALRYDMGQPGIFGAMDEEVGFVGAGINICRSTRQERINDETVCAGGDFDKISLSLQRLQRVTENNSVLIRGLYQWSDDLLTSLEQVGLGGPYTVRAYPVADALVDKGGFATIEWLYEFGNLGFLASDATDWTFFLFADYGGGERNFASGDSPDNDTDKIDLAGWGGGIEFRWRLANRWRFDARLDVATPLTDREAPAYDDDDPRFWGRVNLAFR